MTAKEGERTAVSDATKSQWYVRPKKKKKKNLDYYHRGMGGDRQKGLD